MQKYLVFLLVICASSITSRRIRRVGEPRIIGGEAARAGQFPFAAAIYITTPDGNYFCGGTLLSPLWLLTAGQCVAGATLFTIVLGTNDIAQEGPTSLRLATDTYILHPDFNPTTLENDVGLIQFRQNIGYTYYIKNVHGIRSVADYSIYSTLGWGQTSAAQPGRSDHLHYVALTALTNEECRLYFGSAVVDSMVCAEGNYNEGTCLGDSGSPLFVDSYGLIYHVGISTFISGNGCESTDPSGFTRTRPYCDWITNATDIPASICF